MKNDIFYDKNIKGEGINSFCNCCPRHCNINRKNSFGYCKSKGMRIARFGLHMWEEPCISGDSGSGTIFFSGCSLRCIYCQNFEVSQQSKGYDISVSQLVEIFKRLEELGANNINLVTPTHYVDYIIMALDCYKPSIPICYNTSGYESEESIQKLANYVDIFLVDFKYMDSDIAKEYSKAQDYPLVASRAVKLMRKLQPQDLFDSRGIMQKGLIVRHLVLPNYTENSKAVLNWVADNLGKQTILSIMNQYTPFGQALGHPKIGRKLKPIEYKIVVNHALKLGLENSFVQEDSSANESYIPEFFGDILS